MRPPFPHSRLYRELKSSGDNTSRFVRERSYYTFLAGSYFDSLVEAIASWSTESAPELRRLAFAQDLPPTHGVAAKHTPVAGLPPTPESGNSSDAATSGVSTPRLEVLQEVTATRSSNKQQLSGNHSLDVKSMEFAQPIVFFKFNCVGKLATSAVGRQLHDFVLRIPRRAVLSAVVTIAPSRRPFHSLRSFDLSTTHLPTNTTPTNLPVFLALFPRLEYLTLDRCTGLVGPREDEAGYAPTLKWLGRSIGAAGLRRADEIAKLWKRLAKDRDERLAAAAAATTDGSTTSTAASTDGMTAAERRRLRTGRSAFASMPRRMYTNRESTAAPASSGHSDDDGGGEMELGSRAVVKDVMILPSAPRMRSVGLGLFPLDAKVDAVWQAHLSEGYAEGKARALGKLNDWVSRYRDRQSRRRARLRKAGLSRGGRQGPDHDDDDDEQDSLRLVIFRDVLERLPKNVRHEAVVGLPEPDVMFRRFCDAHELVVVDPAVALESASLFEDAGCGFCTVPDCSNAPGVPHLSLSGPGAQERREVREAREKLIWDDEANERLQWRRPREAHRAGCAHLHRREVWNEEA